MAGRKTERMFNLLILLLTTQRFVSREQIRSIIEGYDQINEAAFERQFERDKDELRALGIEIETGQNNTLFEDEQGYRIRKNNFELPEIEFSPDELAVLGVAARTWHSEIVSAVTASALTKLRAAGIEPDTERLTALSPVLGGSESSFEPLWQAATQRRQVQFKYRGEFRQVDPWLLINRNGAWYLIGYDHMRANPRTYKLTRIENLPKPSKKVASYDLPDAATLRALVAEFDQGTLEKVAIIALAVGDAYDLRRRGRLVVGEPVPAGYEAFEIAYSRTLELVDEVLAAGSAAIVLKPDDLQKHVISRLTYLAGEAQ